MSRNAWTNYWASGARGCVPGCASIASVQAGLWREFAATLPRKARVLDLGTGDGAVLAEIVKGRSDLKLTGVDSATALPSGGKGFKLRPGIEMEQLPFADNSFEAVCSQFGFEYGAVDIVARQVARVLGRGGRFQFLIHHRDSPVLAQGRQRKGALEWAVQASGWFDKARNFLEARRSMRLPTPPTFASAVREARDRFREPVAAEVLAALHQIVTAAEREPAPAALQRLGRLAGDVRDEIERLEALEVAAKDANSMAQVEALLEAAGLSVDAPRVVVDPSVDQPFAWLVRGSRRD